MNTPQQLFTDTYLKITHLFHDSQVKEEQEQAEIRVPEKTIRCIWNDQILNTGSLKTLEGESLEVIFTGYWNFGSGPDFKSGAIRVNGKVYEGDIELHVYKSDWNSHGHSGNSNYDKVILHVFLWKGKDKPIERPEGPYFELELKSYLTKGILELNDELDFDNYPILNAHNYGACHKPLSRLSKEKLADLLNAAGDARVFTKMERFHNPILIKGYEQIFYEGVAEALGYPINKRPFQELAQTLSLEILAKLVPESLSPEERILHIQALMFGIAGLIEFKKMDRASLSKEDEAYFNKLTQLWKSYEAKAPVSYLSANTWKFGGIRPANFPYRRIAALAHLVVRHREKGMFANYIEQFKAAISHDEDKGYLLAKRTAKKIYEYFCVDAPDYWAKHYSPGGKTLSSQQQLIGPARSREITINIVIPIGLIYARSCRSVELESSLNSLFQSGKGTSDNKLMRFVKHYIFGNKKDMIEAMTNNKQAQGLMQVYQDYCTQNENNCLKCQFPDVVNRYFG